MIRRLLCLLELHQYRETGDYAQIGKGSVLAKVACEPCGSSRWYRHDWRKWSRERKKRIRR